MLAGWLSEVSSGEDLKPRLLRLPDGRVLPLPVTRWASPVDAADESLLARAAGPVLDIGCGPGRLTAALHARGVDVLGLELVEQIPVRVRRAGAPLLLGDVFGPLPRAGQWRSVLLADGNIGIGGDPVQLLRRARELLCPQGQVLCELATRRRDVGRSGAARGARNEQYVVLLGTAGQISLTDRRRCRWLHRARELVGTGTRLHGAVTRLTACRYPPGAADRRPARDHVQAAAPYDDRSTSA